MPTPPAVDLGARRELFVGECLIASMPTASRYRAAGTVSRQARPRLRPVRVIPKRQLREMRAVGVWSGEFTRACS
jgi:hypothetical protein